MPLIRKVILVEGAEGETLEKEYYINERPTNPYAELRKKRDRKIQEVLRRPTVENRAHLAREAPAYTWSMGYNFCVGHYSTGRAYCPFGGSSLNRNKSLRHDIFQKEELAPDERNSVGLAIKIAKEYIYARREVPPVEVSDCAALQSKASVRRFRDWLGSTDYRPANGISLPIYVLSPRSRGKIKDKATAFFRSCPGDRVFCTLTFVAAVDDGSAVAILNKFLTALRKEFSGLQYLWVAERQTKNVKYPNNIHFHIILNKRLPIRRYNALWVLQQYKAGLRGETLFGVPVSLSEVEERYKKGTMHRVFNPVDVKRVRSVAGLSAYLTKYIVKQEHGYFACAPWHCSRGVSRLFTKATVGPSAFRYMMGLANCVVDKSTGEVFMPRSIRPAGAKAFCILVYANRKDAPLKYLREMEAINKWLIKGMQLREGHLDTLTDDSYRKLFCKN
jgi:hypothetical protein